MNKDCKAHKDLICISRNSLMQEAKAPPCKYQTKFLIKAKENIALYLCYYFYVITYSMVPNCAHGQNKNIMGKLCETTA